MSGSPSALAGDCCWGDRDDAGGDDHASAAAALDFGAAIATPSGASGGLLLMMASPCSAGGGGDSNGNGSSSGWGIDLLLEEDVEEDDVEYGGGGGAEEEEEGTIESPPGTAASSSGASSAFSCGAIASPGAPAASRVWNLQWYRRRQPPPRHQDTCDDDEEEDDGDDDDSDCTDDDDEAVAERDGNGGDEEDDEKQEDDVRSSQQHHSQQGAAAQQQQQQDQVNEIAPNNKGTTAGSTTTTTARSSSSSRVMGHPVLIPPHPQYGYGYSAASQHQHHQQQPPFPSYFHHHQQPFQHYPATTAASHYYSSMMLYHQQQHQQNAPPSFLAPSTSSSFDHSAAAGSSTSGGGGNDHQGDGQGANKSTKKKKRNARSFPEMLNDMLEIVEMEGRADVVSFFPHGRGFIIHQTRRFVGEILPRFFKQSKITSFQRQLNLYGFKRIYEGPDNGGYYHELFARGRGDLLAQMQRPKTKGGDSAPKKRKAAAKPGPKRSSYVNPPSGFGAGQSGYFLPSCPTQPFACGTYPGGGKGYPVQYQHSSAAPYGQMMGYPPPGFVPFNGYHHPTVTPQLPPSSSTGYHPPTTTASHYAAPAPTPLVFQQQRQYDATPILDAASSSPQTASRLQQNSRQHELSKENKVPQPSPVKLLNHFQQEGSQKLGQL